MHSSLTLRAPGSCSDAGESSSRETGRAAGTSPRRAAERGRAALARRTAGSAALLTWLALAAGPSLAAPLGPLAGVQDSAPAGTELVYGWPTRGLGAVLGALPSDTEPADLPPPPSPASGDPDKLPWRAWGSALERATARSSESTQARAELAQLALERGADSDAWAHLEPLRNSPALLCALVPRLLPGAPAGMGAVTGGLPPALPAGVSLRPALPPASGDPVPDGWLEPRSASLTGLVIGEATVRMSVELRLDGVNVQFDHLSGAPIEFSCRLPCPQGFGRGSEYADWNRQEELGAAHPVRLSAAAPEWRLWLRFTPERRSLPAKPPARLSVQALEAGLEFVTSQGQDALGLAELAGELERLLGLPVTLSDVTAPWTTGPGARPITIDLLSPTGNGPKLLALVSLVERHLLPALPDAAAQTFRPDPSDESASDDPLPRDDAQR